MVTVPYWIFMLWPFLVGAGGNRPKGVHSILTKDLLSDYGPTTPRPVLEAGKQIDVNIDLQLQQVIELTWHDDYLTWNTSTYPDVSFLVIPTSEIWRPDIHLYENVDRAFESIKDVAALLFPDGTVQWTSPVILFTSCRIDARLFPFDTQHCTFRFGSWIYNMDQLNLTPLPRNGSSVGQYFVENGIWELENVVVKHFINEYPAVGLFPEVVFTVILKRRPLFHVFSFIMPCLLLSGLNLLVFILPTESGEKVSLGITNLLALVLFQQLIGDSLPPTSYDMPILGYYFTPMILVGCLSIVSGVVVAALYYHDRTQPVPRWLRKVTGLLPSSSPVKDLGLPSNAANEMKNPLANTNTSIDHESYNKVEHGPLESNGHGISNIGYRVGQTNAAENLEEEQTCSRLAVDYMADWKKVATTIDNFFLTVGTAVTVISVIVTVVVFIITSQREKI